MVFRSLASLSPVPLVSRKDPWTEFDSFDIFDMIESGDRERRVGEVV